MRVQPQIQVVPGLCSSLKHSDAKKIRRVVPATSEA